MKTTIILPAIRVPKNLTAWAPLLEPETDEIIVAGNEASPHTSILEFLDKIRAEHGVETTYLAPYDERVRGTVIHEFIAPNHTARRNFALLEALRRRPDVLVTLDDDNYPKKETWLTGVKALLDPTRDHHRVTISSPTGWYDAGRLCEPPVIHRGYPMSRWREADESQVAGSNARPVGVVASLWEGDPDINAVERLVNDPVVKMVRSNVVLAKGTWCPFDSQSTSVHGTLAHMMFMWPSLGRYDDIWSSYLMRAVMDATGWHVAYGTPAVTQDRNPHNLLRDLKDELFGYEHTEAFTDFLRELGRRVDPNWTTVYDVYRFMMSETLNDFKLLPTETRAGLEAWLYDLERVGH